KSQKQEIEFSGPASTPNLHNAADRASVPPCLRGESLNEFTNARRARRFAGTMEVKLLDLQDQYLPLRNEIRRAIDEVCDAQALILGAVTERFEKRLADYCQTKHAIGVSSGTDALLCALMALGVGAGDEVICPSFTFFATAGSVARL